MNPNTGEAPGEHKLKPRVATNSIFMDATHPSALVLPVVYPEDEVVAGGSQRSEAPAFSQGPKARAAVLVSGRRVAVEALISFARVPARTLHDAIDGVG